ncbi:MAG: SIMPL domain-containing protein [Pseudomonadota bacterium]
MRLVFIVLMLWSAPALAEDAPRIISVRGEGQVTAVPDMAELTLGIVREARRADEALDDVAEGVARLFAILDALNVAPNDRRTSGLSLQPRWDQSSGAVTQRVVGYVASNQVTVRVRDLSVLGGLIGEAVGDGANRLSGLRFVVGDPAPILREARRLAVLDGKDKATLYAETAGVVLGELMSVSDPGAVHPASQPMRAEMAMRSDAMPVAEGELEMRATVLMIYEIAN